MTYPFNLRVTHADHDFGADIKALDKRLERIEKLFTPYDDNVIKVFEECLINLTVAVDSRAMSFHKMQERLERIRNAAAPFRQ
jgi:hypothetical protein